MTDEIDWRSMGGFKKAMDELQKEIEREIGENL